MNLRIEALEVPVNGQSIGGTLIAPAEIEPGSPGTLFVHGWADARRSTSPARAPSPRSAAPA